MNAWQRTERTLKAHDDLTRRSILAIGTVVAATCPAWGATDVALRLYRRATVIDGNLTLAEIIDPKPLSTSAAARIRAGGLTALKWSLADTGMDFASTERQLAELRSAIVRNSGVCLQIEHIIIRRGQALGQDSDYLLLRDSRYRAFR